MQSNCLTCQLEGGVLGHTRLVLLTSENSGYETPTLAVSQNFLARAEDGADRVLNKIQQMGHGREIPVPAGSTDLANMEWFFRPLRSGGVTSGL